MRNVRIFASSIANRNISQSRDQLDATASNAAKLSSWSQLGDSTFHNGDTRRSTSSETLLKVSGLSLEEVARATSTTVGQVKQKAHRAYERLRKLLGTHAEGVGDGGTR